MPTQTGLASAHEVVGVPEPTAASRTPFGFFQDGDVGCNLTSRVPLLGVPGRLLA